VLVLTVVDHPIVLVGALRQAAVQGDARREVVDVAEAERRAHRVVVRDLGGGDVCVQAHRGLAALVALHAARLGAEVRHVRAGREGDGVESQGGVVVARIALDRAADLGGVVHHAGGRPVVTEEVPEPVRAVALRAALGDLAVLVPVGERLCLRVRVAGALPLLLEGHIRAGVDRRVVHRDLDDLGDLLHRRASVASRRQRDEGQHEEQRESRVEQARRRNGSSMHLSSSLSQAARAAGREQENFESRWRVNRPGHVSGLDRLRPRAGPRLFRLCRSAVAPGHPGPPERRVRSPATFAGTGWKLASSWPIDNDNTVAILPRLNLA